MKELPPISKHIFFFALFSILIGLVLYISSSYLNLIAMACIYSVIVYPLYNWILTKRPGMKPWLAVLLILLLSILLIVIPLIIILTGLIRQVYSLIDLVKTTFDIAYINEAIANINKLLADNKLDQYQINLDELEAKLSTMVGTFTQSVAKTLQIVLSLSFATIFDGFVFVILIFVIIPNGKNLLSFIKGFIPMENRIKDLYLRRSKLITVDIVKGTFILAFLQGIVAGGFCYILGIPNSLLITFMVMVFAIVPVVGSAFVTVPIAVFYLLTGDYFTGIALLLWQIFVVATVDNIVRPFIVSDETNLHPALMLFSYLGGIKVFGPIGLIYGPLIFVLFLTSLEVFQSIYLNKPISLKGASDGSNKEVKFRIPGMDKYISKARGRLENLRNSNND